MDNNELKNCENEQAEQIIDQSTLSIKSNRSLFIIVYYHHENDKLRFIHRLKLTAKACNLSTRSFDPWHRAQHGPGKLYSLISSTSKDKILCLVNDLPRTDDNSRLDSTFLEYMNIHRDEIAREHIRFVLFIHNGDAKQFITSAGDLWDFRHRTYWLETRQEIKTTLLQENHIKMSAPPTVDDSALEEIKSHIKNVHTLIQETESGEDRAALLLDLSQWLIRRNAFHAATEAAREGIGLLNDDISNLRADLEYSLRDAFEKSSNISEAHNHLNLSIFQYK